MQLICCLLSKSPPLYTDTTCTDPSEHLHTPLAAPNNTYTTHLSSSECNTCITTLTLNTPDLTDTRTRYQLNTTAYTYTHETPTTFTAHYSTQRHCGSHILRFCSPLVTVQNTMGIMTPEACWDRSLIINIRLVTSCWFLSLHPMFMTHGHKSLKDLGMFAKIILN